MKINKMLLIGFLIVSLVVSAFAFDPPPADQDTIFIEGGPINEGTIESVIGGDISEDSTRVNPNRVYVLEGGTVHWFNKGFDFKTAEGVDGTLHIVGEPGAKKPILQPAAVAGEGPGQNNIDGSLHFDNIYFRAKPTNNVAGQYYYWWGEGHNDDLILENSVFEYANGPFFRWNGHTGELDIFVENCYFRNVGDGEDQDWWDSRAFEAKVPVDTFSMENNTVHNAHLTLLLQHYKIEYQYINHNTFINSVKYVFQNPYVKEGYMTNNIFVNCNWAGEDENVKKSGQDPDGLFTGIVNVDTIKEGQTTENVDYGPRYEIDNYKWYVSNNVHWVDPLLDPYYNGEYNDQYDDAPVSNIDWGFGKPSPIENTPPIWMNSRTKQLFNDHDAMFADKNYVHETETEVDPQLNTPAIASEAVRDSMVLFNQIAWGALSYSTKFSEGASLGSTPWSVGDPSQDATKYPGVGTNDADVENVSIYEPHQLPEDWSYNADLTSTIDGKPLGSLQWYPDEMESYDSESAKEAVYAGWEARNTKVDNGNSEANSFKLEQNYPNPFNPVTNIKYTLDQPGKVKLTIYNILGEKVKTLINGQSPASNSVKWNATNSAGEKVSSGIYLYKLETENHVTMKKMMLLK